MMKTFNLNRTGGRFLTALVFIFSLAIGNAWASTSKTYYATMNVAATGSGTVYVTSSGKASDTKSTSSTSSSASISFNIYATANTGYKFSSWSGSGITFGSATTANTTGAISSSSTSSPGTSKTATASFVAIEATAAPANVNIAAEDPSTVYPESTEARTLTFTTTSNNALTDFTYAPANGASGKYTFSNWRRVDATHVAVDYTFAGGGNYGGLTRVHPVNVTLKGKEHATTKTCTITATFPNAKIIDGAAEEVFAAYNPADATQTGVAKTAVFDVEYVDGTNNFDTPTFTGAGASHFTYNSMSYADGKLTVNYTYNGNKENGTHTATLTLKVNNAIGGTDATYGSKAITITVHNEQEATDDAKVIAADGETLIYQGDWATAWTRANTAANAGCTLYLLRNVGGLTAYVEVKNTFTLDLNGKILSGKRNGTLIYLNTTGKTLTVKDSKTGGAIQHIHNEYSGTPVCVNLTKGSLILESGTLYCENKGASGRKAGGVICKAGTTFTMNGGKIDVWGYNGAYGVNQESDKNDNTTFTMNNGEIVALGYSDIYGVQAAGKVDIKEGTTISATATYSNCRGITLSAAASATPANCYWGTLTMKGGTINSTCTANADGTRYAYGVYFDCANTAMGTATATDGSHANKAASTGTIENATINVSTLGRYAYGVIANGSYQSKTNHYDVIQIKNTKIDVTSQYYYTYGVYANGSINTTHGAIYFANIELTDCEVTATTTKNHTAYAVWAVASANTVYKNAQPNYYGEYAGGATVTVNSGTYTANTGTTYAYAIGTSARAKSTYDSESDVTDERKLGGNAEGYATLNIHGGKFVANAGTTTSRAVSNGGNCTIDGGEFYATSGSTTADGIYTVSGKLKASGVKIEASATSTVYGVRVDAANVPYNTDAAWTGFNYAGDAELNNLDVTVTARTGATAYGVYVNATAYQYTQSAYDTYMQGRIDAGKVTQANADIWAAVFPGNSSYAIGAKAVINGGTYTVSTATTSAYGVWMKEDQVAADKGAHAAPEASINNAKFIVTTNGTTTAYGVYSGGNVTIDGCDFTVQPKTTTAYGVYQYSNKATITNTKFDVKGTTTVYGLYANAAISGTHGWDYHGEFELGEGNDMTVAATSGDAAHVMTLIASKKNINVDGGAYNGDYANAATAHITGGSYKATATGKTCYVLNLSANQVQNAVSAAPTCTIEGGKFWAKATGGTDGICTTNGVNGNILFKGGVYNVNTTLAKHIPEGLEEVTLPSDRPEYAEGYRYEVGEMGVHGGYVCQIGSNKYRTLEEALQVVTSGQVIYMIDNYNMMTPGDYILPSGATLLIPYKTGTGKGASTAIGNSAVTNTSAVAPYLFRKLTFGPGVNLTCSGTIETSAEQKANGQYAACVGMPSGAYGQIHLMEGSHISLESGSRLNCWGYVTGKGTINAKNGSTVLEGFQLGDWCGGTNASTLLNNSQKVFPITHYFYQSIECPITYRPGCSALGSTHIYASSTVGGQDAVKLVGTSGALFLMDNKDASEDTWVMKDYDETTDQCVWTMNSGATLGNLSINMSVGWTSYNFASANYDLPITTNMTIILNNGKIGLSQNTVFLPGSKLIVNKQGTLEIDGINVVAYDAAEWTGTTVYRASYSPTWGTTNPRSTTAVDAEFFLHGKVNIKSNGGLYTTESGANVHSTNADAGEVIYTTAAQGNKTSYYLQQGGTTRTSRTAYPAKLKNGDGSYAASAGTAAGKTWTYKNDVWDAWSKDGCFLMDAQDKPHAKPAELVELTSKTPDANHLHHDAATGARNFVWDENCYWWEVVTTPTAEGYYQALNADNNGKYNYYEYNSAAGCWKIKTLTVTWSINGSNTDYTVGYGTKPHWLGATPTKTSTSSDFVWRWDGWTLGSDPTVYENEELPVVTANTTFTAHFYEKYYQSLVTFKNSDGTILDSKLWNRGSIPSYEGTPTKEATASQTFEFNGNWSPAITAVGSSPVEYVAQYTATTRQYNVEFLNYDMSVLGTAKVDYDATPTTATYKAAIAPSDFEPYKPDNSAYSFEFDEWRLQGASSNGFAQVKGDQTYIAQFKETTKKYLIAFVDDDGETVLHWTQLEYDAMPSYDGPATSGFNKQDAEWDYVFNGWSPAEFTQVKGPQTYTATYSTIARMYTITWKNGDKEIYTTCEYGGTPAYNASQPSYPNPQEGYTYEFTGWSPEIHEVVDENNTYTAQYDLVGITANENQTQTISENTSVSTATVKIHGRMSVSPGATLTTDDLILEATPSSSGELVGESNVVATNAYFEFSQPGGFKARTWYAVAVPWQVEANGGISAKKGDGDFASLQLGSAIDLIYYKGDIRAASGPINECWQYVEDDPSNLQIMQQGRAYMFCLYTPADIVRFARKSGTEFKTTLSVETYNSTTGKDNDANWNGIANPATYHAYINANAGEYQGTENAGQVYDADNKSYKVINLSTTQLLVGQPVFVQATTPNNDIHAYANKESAYPTLAPRRAKAQSTRLTRYEIQLVANDSEKADRIIVRLDEDKEKDEYVVGKDLIKMGLSSLVPQIYINRYGSAMCINTAKPIHDKAEYPLGIFAPEAGEYDIFVAEASNEDVNIYLTYNGKAIWNLAYGPYTIALDKGTTNSYGLRLSAPAPQVTTGIEEAVVDAQGETRKVLINNHVFIIRGNNVYGIDGQLIK